MDDKQENTGHNITPWKLEGCSHCQAPLDNGRKKGTPVATSPCDWNCSQRQVVSPRDFDTISKAFALCGMTGADLDPYLGTINGEAPTPDSTSESDAKEW